MDIKDIGRIVKERRVFLKVNQEDIAEISGISVRTLRDIEKGKTNPEFKSLLTILEVLGLKLNIEVKV